MQREIISIREATLNDYHDVYEWLYYSDFSDLLNRVQGITPDLIPTFEGFKNEYYPYFFDGSAKEKGQSFMIKLNDKTVGHISYTSFHALEGITEFDIWLKGLEYTGKGIGTKAIELLAAKMFEKGYSTIIIRPSKENIRAIKAYKKAGFKECELILKDYYKPEFIDLYGDGDCGKDNDLFLVLKNNTLYSINH